MCGIFGVLSLSKEINTKYLNSLSFNLFKLSESRGKDACGIFSINESKIPIIKSNTKVTNLVKTDTFNKFMNLNLQNRINEELYCVMGHSRMVTSGSSYNINNNQPIIKDNLLFLHNGIITNENTLTNQLKKKQHKRKYEVDTEIYAILVYDFIRKGFSFLDACKKSFKA